MPAGSRQGNSMFAVLKGSALSAIVLLGIYPPLNADETISIWVDNAPLQMVIKELGLLSGKQVSMPDNLDGHVSGRFGGSMENTLDSIAESHAVLFDVGDETLDVVDAKQKISATVALDDEALPETFQTILQYAAIGGNQVQFREGEVSVSGHPAFVSRTTKTVTAQLAGSGKEALVSTDESVALTEDIVLAEPVTQSVAQEENLATVQEDSDVEIEAVTVASESSTQAEAQDNQSITLQQQEDAVSLPKPIRWVTDIPGFNTF